MSDTRRSRRRRSASLDKQEIVNRVLDFYERDLTDSSVDREIRLQRYAKLRMWTEDKDWPWENASNISLPDIMEKSLRMQDTLHNAVMTQRPPIGAKARKEGDKEKEKNVDNLIDYQFFEEQPGEIIVGDLADAFINDGVFTAFIPWVKEKREIRQTRTFDPIPEDVEPAVYFHGLLRQTFPESAPVQKGDGWDWDILGKENFEARFYTKADEVEMVLIKEVERYNGPRVIVKDYEDVLHPPRAANLQIPGPSNPGGASHVIMRDYPAVDEVKRLAKNKFYDLVDKNALDSLENTGGKEDDDEKTQKDDLGGKTIDEPKVKSHKTLTRLMCFDSFDIDGDGIDEDMIFWVIKETKTLLKAVPLTELYPANPPRRPFAEASMLPVRGRRGGISIPELLEGLHDAQKMLFDQTIDNGTIRNAPFFFYRASGSMKQDVIRLWPGEGYPLGDPQRDVNFPSFGNSNSDAFGINMLSILGTQEERLTEIGDLQLGRVPPGKASALRTVGGMSLIAGQGEARPERILRRFFVGLTEIWHQIHELNQAFLPKEKQIRIFDLPKPSQDPYQTVSRDGIEGRFQFGFSANVMNASKQAMQEAIGGLLEVYVTPLMLQMGAIDEGGIYRLARDYGKALGQDPDKYLREPTPGAMLPRITAEEAISQILSSQIPDGEPAEGAAAHLQAIVAYEKTDELGNLNSDQVELLRGYKQILEQKIVEEQQRQALVDAAGQSGQAQGQPGTPSNGAENPNQQPVIQGNELLDETLPTAGGGGTQ